MFLLSKLSKIEFLLMNFVHLKELFESEILSGV